MDGFVQDLRFGARALVRRPLFAVVSTATLALGIGASTTVFTVVHAVVLRPLPVPEADSVVMVWETVPEGRTTVASAANYVDWRAAADGFEHLALLAGWNPTMVGADEPRLLSGARVTPNFLSTLGLRPAHGRDFTESEGEPGAEPVVLLSEALWREAFAGDPAVVGRSLVLAGRAHTVVGVAPAELGSLGLGQQVWTPIVLEEGAWLEYRGRHNVRVLGRLAPGVAFEAAQRQMDQIAARLARQFPDTNEGYGVRLQRLEEVVVGGFDRPMWMLLAAVGLVLLIACANVASLTLTRGMARRPELALHAALGADRRRLLRKLLVEAGLVAGAGGALGLLAATWGFGLARGVIPASVPRIDEASVDGAVVAFAALVTACCVILSGVLPGLRLSSGGLARAMAAAEWAISGTRRDRRTRAALVGAEAAIAVVLLVGAGLFIRSLVNLGAVDLGIRTDGVHAASIFLPAEPYSDPGPTRSMVQRAVAELERLPGVEMAAVASQSPLTFQGLTFSFSIEGGTQSGPAGPQTTFRIVSPSYFATLGIELRRGRGFAAADRPGSPRVVVVNEELARRYWPGGDPVGQRVSFRRDDDGRPIWEEVVGVVADVRELGPGASPLPLMYQSSMQAEETWGWIGSSVSLLARSDGAAADVMAALRATVHAIDPGIPVYRAETLAGYLSRTTATTRFQTVLLGVFGAIATVLAAVGIYGVLSFAVGQRAREIGLRKALGARDADVLRGVVADALRPAALGILAGLVVAAGLGRLVASQLFEVGPVDPITYAGVALLLVIVASLACWMPARRAARIDPIRALGDG